jgi:beta-N-acetylhexosaminidase
MTYHSLTTAQLAGQRLMVGFDGTELNGQLRHLIKHLKIGGLILFSRNIQSPPQVKELCAAVQEYAGMFGGPPLFIAVDQEGGQVARFKEPFTRFPGNPFMTSIDDALEFASVTAAELSRVGVNMNMAPVLDVVPPGIEGVMSKRVFGSDPQWVATMGATVIDHLQQGTIMAVAKHFPGIGRTTLDSHEDLPHLEVDREQLESFDIIPFRSAIAHSVAGIMLSHIAYRKIDPLWPASLSPQIAKHYLRDHLVFNGITLTDDLDMGAIVNHFDIRTVIHQILQAEIDLALICHQGPNIETAFEEISQALTDASQIRDACRASVQRILSLKRRYISPARSAIAGKDII